MDIIQFQAEATFLIEKFQELINVMPQKGNTISECQRLCLQQHLNELDSAVTGTEQDDLEPDLECPNCCWKGVEAKLKNFTDLSNREVGYYKGCPECETNEDDF